MPTPLNSRQYKKKLQKLSDAGAHRCELHHVGSLDDFYAQLRSQLELPEGFGDNLDALYDTLAADYPAPVLLIWNHFHESRRRMGEDCQNLYEVLRAVGRERDDFHLLLDTSPEEA